MQIIFYYLLSIIEPFVISPYYVITTALRQLMRNLLESFIKFGIYLCLTVNVSLLIVTLFNSYKEILMLMLLLFKLSLFAFTAEILYSIRHRNYVLMLECLLGVISLQTMYSVLVTLLRMWPSFLLGISASVIYVAKLVVFDQ